MFARLGRRAIAVALEKPLAVVATGEAAYRVAELLEGLEALDPEHLFLERLDEALDAAVRLRLVVEGRGADDAEVVDLDLVVMAAEAGASVIAQRQPGGDRPLERAEPFGADLAQQIGGSEAVHPQRRVRPRFAAGVVDDAEDRGGVLARPCLGRVGRPERVGHRDADRTLVQPLRTLAHPPGRREQPRLTGQPEHALAARAHTFALEPSPKLCGCPSPTNGESASATRISASSSPLFIAPTGPGLRRVIAETLRRRRCSHAATATPPPPGTRSSAARAAPCLPRAPRRLRVALLLQ